jgi:hypothetical protein
MASGLSILNPGIARIPADGRTTTPIIRSTTSGTKISAGDKLEVVYLRSGNRLVNLGFLEGVWTRSIFLIIFFDSPLEILSWVDLIRH